MSSNEPRRDVTYLLARQRSGTNVLRTCLNSHANLFAVNEIMDSTIFKNFEGIENFAEYVREGKEAQGIFFPYYRKQLLNRPAEFLPSMTAFKWLTDMIVESATKQHVIFDLKYSSLWNLHNNWPSLTPVPPVLNYARKSGFRIFHLTRKNALANLCSMVASNQTHVYQLKSDSDEQYERQLLKLDPETIVDQLQAYRNEQTMVRDYFADHADYFECDYGELFDETGCFSEALFREISQFYDIPFEFNLKPKHRKLGSKNLADTIHNYNEIAEVLTGTDFEHCLDKLRPTAASSRMSKLSDKTFFLGIGAQKAGTTWLYDYLSKCHDVLLSPIKEMHYFDARYRPDLCGMFDRQRVKLLERTRASMEASGGPNNRTERNRLSAQADRVAMIDDESRYLKHFEDRIRPHHKIFGEVTPSYALIGEDGFQEIRNLSESVRVVFLLRDPVDRYWSALKQFEKGQQNPERWFVAIDRYLEELENPAFIERTRYEDTIRVLESVFAPEERLIMLYENLFNEDSTRQICEFLGIEYRSANYGSRINASRSDVAVDDTLQRVAFEKFSGTYAFISEYFDGSLPTAWTDKVAKFGSS